MFIGLNPSIADHRQDDPTIRRCVGFAKGFGYGGFEMLNVFGFRSTDPAGLETAKDPVGPLNITAILSAAQRCGVCIVGWGALYRRWRTVLDFDRRTLAMLGMVLNSGFHPQVYCLGVTKEGFPRHPLFVKASTQLQVYTNPRLVKYQVAIEKRRRNKAS
jgi:hypothetical protein